MGGRVAEEIIFNVQTSGAQNDFEQATVSTCNGYWRYGMSENLDQSNMKVISAMNPGQFTTDKSYSAHTAQLIDRRNSITFSWEAHDKGWNYQCKPRNTCTIAEALLKYETLDVAQIKSILWDW